jgi:hypothetical protein
VNEATTPELRGSHIKANLYHGAGAYARCSYCRRYSDDPATLGDRPPACDCGEKHGWSGSFVPPTAESKWSGAALARRPSVGGVTDAQIDAIWDGLIDGHAKSRYDIARAILALQPSAPQPVAHSKSQYKRLSAMGADVVSKDAVDAERYRWWSSRPNIRLNFYEGKYRVVDSEYLITDWFDSADAAIDAAVRAGGGAQK